MSVSYLLGIDAGTTVIKSTLFDLEGREIAGAAHDSSFLTPHPGWAESDMNTVWQAVAITVRQALERGAIDPAQVLAIGVTGQGDGTWLVDGDGAPVRPAILWSDGRTADLVREFWRTGVGQQLFQITGTALNTCNQAVHLHWLQENEPETLARTAGALRAKDWIFLCMTGVVSTDATDASHTYFSVQTQTYDDRILKLLGVERWKHAIPAAPRPEAHKAPLLDAVAKELGLLSGTPVVAGPFDVAASALGVGAAFPGDACSVLGTAGVHQVMVDKPVLEPADIGYNMQHAPEGVMIRLLPTMTSTQNLQWFAREFYAQEWAEAQQSGANIWDVLERIAQQEPPGARGVIYHPYLDPAGERAPFISSAARAQFSGVSAYHTRATLLRAVYEGVVLSVIDCYETMGAPVTSLRLAGGGARSPLWAQMLADALAAPVIVAEGSEYGARGAVINAAVATGCFASYAEAVASMVRPARTVEPAPGHRGRYQAMLRVYRAEREAMMSVWEMRKTIISA
ncbi:MAG: FGGY-family carbohydrate kinase [Caldilinea sp.]